MSAIFISHSSKDNEFASELKGWLENQGYRSLFLDFDPADGIPAGRNWEQELYKRLHVCRAVIVLISRHSMASEWCFAEITHARALGKIVLGLKIEPCEIKSILRDTQTVDFTGNQNEARERLRRGMLVAGLDPRDSFNWDGSRPPYPGLMAFQEEDTAIYFGRDEAIRKALETLNRLQQFNLWTERLGAARAAWERSGRDEGALLRGALLAEAEHWLRDRTTEVSIRDADFIRASSGFQREELARWKNLNEEAERSRQVALARQLAAQAQGVRGDSSLALLQSVTMAAESLRHQPTVEGDQAFRRGLALLPLVVAVPAPAGDERITCLGFTPDGQCLVEGSSSGRLRFFDLHRGREAAHLESLPGLSAFVLSPNGQYLAAVNDQPFVDLWTSDNQVAPNSMSSALCSSRS